MIHILILCKEKKDIAVLSDSLCRCVEDSLCLISTVDPEEAKTIITRREITFDLFILGVRLGKRSGYIMEKMIRQYHIYKQTPILFVTEESYNLIGFPPLATFQAYKRCNYLSLPLDKIDIQAKVSLYLDAIADRQRQNEESRRCLDLKGSGGIEKVPLKSILYLEIQNKTCSIYTLQGKYIVKRTSLIRVLEEICSDDVIRCHRFFAVNIKNIDFVERHDSRIWYLHLKGTNQTCPASRVYLKDILPFA